MCAARNQPARPPPPGTGGDWRCGGVVIRTPAAYNRRQLDDFGCALEALSPPRTQSLATALLPAGELKWRLARDLALVVGCCLFTALLARFSVHLPFSPVPITGQTLAVLLTGAALGSVRGAAAMLLYLAAGSQLPFFAGAADDYLWSASGGGYLFGFTGGSSGLFWELASGGYIIGFIPAAALVGFLCERGFDRKPWIVAAMLLGNAVLYIPGLIQLSLFVPEGKTLEWGLYPFIPGDLAKLCAAAMLLPAAWGLLSLKRGRNAGLWM